MNKTLMYAIAFQKAARVLGLGESTISIQDAKNLAGWSLSYFDNIQKEIRDQYPSQNFIQALKDISSTGKTSPATWDMAMKEFNSGICNLGDFSSKASQIRNLAYAE